MSGVACFITRKWLLLTFQHFKANLKIFTRNGARMKINNLGSVNVNPRALEEFFREDCIEVSFSHQISLQVLHNFYQIATTFLTDEI
jgi:hypothetical protein